MLKWQPGRGGSASLDKAAPQGEGSTVTAFQVTVVLGRTSCAWRGRDTLLRWSVLGSTGKPFSRSGRLGLSAPPQTPKPSRGPRCRFFGLCWLRAGHPASAFFETPVVTMPMEPTVLSLEDLGLRRRFPPRSKFG